MKKGIGQKGSKMMVQSNTASRFMLRSATVVLASILLTSCSFNQNPFEEKSDQIKNGIPPELDKEPPVPKPLASDALRIDTLDFYTFKEEQAGEISIAGRVLSANPQFELSIDASSLKDFPGADFDPKTGIFKWTPPRDSTGSDYGVPKRLLVRLTAPSPTGTIIGTTKSILVYVTRSEVDPEIVSIEDMVRTPVREGEARKFNVVVRDPDSSDVDGLRPRLVAIPSARGPNDISGLIYMQESSSSNPNPVQDPVDKKLWTFKMVLNLMPVAPDMRGRDFTRLEDRFKFGLQVNSRFGRVALKNDGEVQIITEVMKPEISWFDKINVYSEQENVVQFTVFDPYAEGSLSVTLQTRIDLELPGPSTWKCKTASREGNQLCQLTWKPVNPTKTEYAIEFEVINKSKVPGDIKFQKETFRRVLAVQKPATTVPAPATPPSTPVAPATGTPVAAPTVN